MAPGNEPEPANFVTVDEVARHLRVSKMTVYRLIHSGELRCVRIGRSFRIPADAVNEYLNRQLGE
jgi:excisionase family DNA binding protein